MAERPIPFQPGFASIEFEHGKVVQDGNEQPIIAMFLHTANATVCTMWDAVSLGKMLDAGMAFLDSAPPPDIVIAGPDALGHLDRMRDGQ